jgi:hypothetical protein
MGIGYNIHIDYEMELIIRTLCSHNVIKFPYYGNLSKGLRCETRALIFI